MAIFEVVCSHVLLFGHGFKPLSVARLGENGHFWLHSLIILGGEWHGLAMVKICFGWERGRQHTQKTEKENFNVTWPAWLCGPGKATFGFVQSSDSSCIWFPLCLWKQNYATFCQKPKIHQNPYVNPSTFFPPKRKHIYDFG